MVSKKLILSSTLSCKNLHCWWIQNLTHVYQSWTIYLLDDYNEDGDHTVCSAGEMTVYADSCKHSQTLCLEYILSIFYILYLYCRIMHLSLHKICPRKCDSHQSHMNTWVITCSWLLSKVEDDERVGKIGYKKPCATCTYFTLLKSVLALHTETFALELSLLLYLAYCHIWLPAGLTRSQL